MPDLLFSIPSERVLAADDGSVSLITVLEALEVQDQPGMPEKFLMPIKWSVVTLWCRNAQDEPGTEFEQQLRVLDTEDKEAILTHDLSFKLTSQHINYRNQSTFYGFPVYKSGVSRIEVYLRIKGQSKWKKYASFPVNILRKPIKEKKGASNKNNKKPS